MSNIMITKKQLILFALLIATSFVRGQVTFNPIFASHMVLQQNAEVRIWGTANSFEKVSVQASFLSAAIKTKANKNGEWLVKFNTPSFGGPYMMIVQGEKSEQKVDDIYIGEVWLASGQSNMEYPLDSVSKGYYGAVNYKEEVKAADYPLIRQYLVKDEFSRSEKTVNDGEWLIVKPGNARKLSAVAYFYARSLYKNLNMPIGIINAAWGGTPIYTWMSPMQLKEFPDAVKSIQKINEDSIKFNQNYPTALYNGMIAPIRNYTIKGVIWNQGENSITNPVRYSEYMNYLVNGWRKLFDNKNMPFLYVQLAPFNYAYKGSKGRTENSLGYLVEQQVKALTIKNVFMARTGDIGTINNIHYNNKQEVGNRLALLSLKEIYHQGEGLVNGPDVQKIVYNGNKAIISYANTGLGLRSKGETITGFELSQDGTTFYPATALIKGNIVELNAPDIAKPSAIRYCFKNIQKVNLFNSAGLPAMPFRTDSMPFLKPQ